ncbi:E3 ubiquitin-protein ligase TRIM71 [Geobacter sp. OR-1]|uniref:6-bladed beta-propeller n=1 Tax=Geobacter sp. OR-1 TaxID=1266765 RepID=UPI000542D256|nr:6-bladed beta-propeller [Geobacter sp. OR-1]GAM10659.1 E3 ubiquitin-protein ligase TRIM71 [Geobacter sp. OR-1]
MLPKYRLNVTLLISEVQSILRLFLICLILIFAALAAGCSTVNPLIMRDLSVNLYWPSKPDTPKIQFLREIKGPEEIIPDKSRMQKIAEMFTGDGSSILELISPSSVAISDDNVLYIADTFAGAIHRYDLISRDISYITLAGDVQLASPVAVAVDYERNLYVSDSINAKVYKFNSAGILIKDIAPLEGFKRPAGIAISSNGEKFVADALANKLHKFSPNDDYLGEFPKYSKGEDLNTPSHVAIDKADNVYVTDAMNFSVKIYDKDGNFIRRIGEAGDVPGSFSRPKGVALDSDGNIYVVDANHDNIQIFNRDGQLLLFFGSSGSGPGQFYLPNGIYIDRMDRIFLADTFNRRVQVFKYLKTGGKYE